MRNFKSFFISLAITVLALPVLSCAEVVAVDLAENGKLLSEIPTQTLYWKAPTPSAVLVLIPGGDGHIGIRTDTVDLRHPFYLALKTLTNPDLTTGSFDVVIFDSPKPLSPGQRYPSDRGSSDHIKRIESVVSNYRERTGLPIFIMGHSNGGISLMEFIRYLQKNKKTQIISGMIVSSARNEASFSAPIDFPVLFIDHKSNACSVTLRAVYDTYGKEKRSPALTWNKA